MLCFTKNLNAFIIVNSILVISNFYSRGMPWSLFVINFWGLILLIKGIKIFYPESKYNSPLFKHYLIYSSFGFFLFLLYSYIGCNHHYCHRSTLLGVFMLGLPMTIWTVILLIHFLVVKGKKKEFRFCGLKISRENEEHKEEEFEIIEKSELIENGNVIHHEKTSPTLTVKNVGLVGRKEVSLSGAQS